MCPRGYTVATITPVVSEIKISSNKNLRCIKFDCVFIPKTVSLCSPHKQKPLRTQPIQNSVPPPRRAPSHNISFPEIPRSLNINCESRSAHKLSAGHNMQIRVKRKPSLIRSYLFTISPSACININRSTFLSWCIFLRRNNVRHSPTTSP